MKSTKPLIFPSDYDALGRLQLPWLFWCVLLLQMRAFARALHAIAFENVHFEGLDLLYVVFPGIPALVVFALFSRVRRYWSWKLWCLGRWVLIFGQCLQLVWPLLHWFNGESITGWALAFFVINISALWWVCSSQRLWACFTSEYGYPSFHYKNIRY